MEQGTKLTQYKLVRTKGLGSLRTTAGLISLEHITDEQAAKLYEEKSPYIEKVEKAPSTEKKK